MATGHTLMTVEEFLALPDDGVERELIRGELRERPMTTRSYPHSVVNSRLPQILWNWVDQQPKPRGRVVCGEARFVIRHNPDTTVGIDVAYIGPELAARTPRLAKFVDGPPVLAIEILSPSDNEEDLDEKIQLYLDCGVALVWIVDSHWETVMVYRPDAPPVLFNTTQEIDAEPHLPGFRVPVARIFD